MKTLLIVLKRIRSQAALSLGVTLSSGLTDESANNLTDESGNLLFSSGN